MGKLYNAHILLIIINKIYLKTLILYSFNFIFNFFMGKNKIKTILFQYIFLYFIFINIYNIN